MAPEIVRKEGHSFSADVWSLGCVLIEMVSGHPPWSNYSRNAKEVLHLISLPNNVPDMPNCSKELGSFISLCLQRDSDSRPTINQLLRHSFLEFDEWNVELSQNSTMSRTMNTTARMDTSRARGTNESLLKAIKEAKAEFS